MEDILDQENAIDIIVKPPSKVGYRQGTTVLGNEKVKLTLMNADPLTEDVNVVTSYTNDTEQVEFK